MHEKQLQKLDQYVMQINNDTTLKHKIEKINLLLTNQKPITLLSAKNGNNNNNESDQLGVSPSSKPDTSHVVGLELANSANLFADDDSNLLTNVNYDLIDMLLIDLRKYIANSVAVWNSRMSELFKKTKFDDVNSLMFHIDDRNLY